MRIRKVLCPLFLVGAVASAALPGLSFAQANVDPEQLKLAAEEFDAGRRAYKSGDYERAAGHFENAFRDAPSSQAIRMAIRARNEAGDFARAATLCVRAQALYPDDSETIELAQRVLRAATPKLTKITVNCDIACTVSLDGRIVQDDAARRQVFYAPPGEHTVVAGWGKDRSGSKDLDGKPGEATTLEFTAPPEPEKAPPPATAPPAPSTPPASSAAVEVQHTPSGKAPPLLFWLGAAATSVFAGATVWSGIDTLNNPGPDAVEEACVGKGTSCPEYQDGLNKQTRTNYLLISTGVGVASVAVIGIFFTDWGGGEPARDEGKKVGFVPSVDPRGGVGMTATGRF